jgi:hypothetical protein
VPQDDREQRLRELTEQALQLLDQLALARKQAIEAEAERRRWHRECSLLHQRLAETQARVRAGSALHFVPGAVAPSGRGAVEAFVCVDDALAEPERDRWLAALRKWLETVPATVVVPRGGGPPERVLNLLGGVRVLEAAAHTPAQLWNHALASSTAGTVVLVGSGAVPDRSLRLEGFSAFDDEIVALLQPALARDEGQWTLGLSAEPGFILAPQRVRLGEQGDEPRELDFAAPELFAVRQAAFTRLGPFDGDLMGRAALAEYSLRARRAGMRILGTTSLRAEVRFAPGDADPTWARDRLIVLARHDAGELVSALARGNDLGMVPAGERAAYVAALLGRLPGADQPAEVLRVAAAAIAGALREVVSMSELDAHVAQMEEALQIGLRGGDARSWSMAESLAAIVDRARTLVDRLQALERSAEENARLHQALHAANVERVAAERMAEQASSQLDRVTRELTATLASHMSLRGALAPVLRLGNDVEERALVDAVVRLNEELVARDAWVATLLRERRRRRLKLFPKLDAAEERFLADFERRASLGRDASSP